jgi:hypothetical protein
MSEIAEMRKPALTEAQKTLAKELARVIERLRSPPLIHGLARELRKQRDPSWKARLPSWPRL